MTLLESIAAILSYPDDRYQQVVRAAVASATVESALPLSTFAESVKDRSVTELQELYIQSFDLNPVCALEIGWHLFGENYDRGILLVRMRALLDKHGLRESSELPDHLTHALLLLDRMNEADALDFAGACLVPAMQKMREAIEGKNIPFEPVIEAVLRILYARFPEIPLPVKRDRGVQTEARGAGVSPAVAGRPAPGDHDVERSGAGRRIAAGETPAPQQVTIDRAAADSSTASFSGDVEVPA